MHSIYALQWLVLTIVLQGNSFAIECSRFNLWKQFSESILTIRHENPFVNRKNPFWELFTSLSTSCTQERRLENLFRTSRADLLIRNFLTTHSQPASARVEIKTFPQKFGMSYFGLLVFTPCRFVGNCRLPRDLTRINWITPSSVSKWLLVVKIGWLQAIRGGLLDLFKCLIKLKIF